MMDEAVSKAVNRNVVSQEEAWKAVLSESSYNHLLRYALHLTGNQAAAEDITQAAFLRLLHLLKQKQWTLEVNYVQAYLSKIINNLCKDMRKNQRKEMAVSLDDAEVLERLEHATAQTDNSVSEIENRIYHKELYNSLPFKVILTGITDYEKQLLFMSRVDGLSVKEIASVLDKDINQVRYGLQKLEAKIRYRVRKLVKETSGGTLF